MQHLTVRNVPSPLARALDDEKHRRGTSLNQTVIDLLSCCLGVDGSGRRSNGLSRLAGSWTDEEADAFATALDMLQRDDEGLTR